MKYIIDHIFKDRWVLASCTISLLLLFLRMTFMQHIQYVFLVWNLFLAVIPYVLGKLLNSQTLASAPFRALWITITKLFLVGCWLLFLPNAVYIITDFVHLTHYTNAQFVFDTVLLASFSLAGMILAFKSMQEVQTTIQRTFHNFNHVWLHYLVLFLCAFGVYLGRVLRWNSWDILQDPFGLARDIINLLIYPTAHGYSWVFIASFTVFLSLVYYIFQKYSYEKEI